MRVGYAKVTAEGCRGVEVGVADWSVFYKTVVVRVGCLFAESELLALESESLLAESESLIFRIGVTCF